MIEFKESEVIAQLQKDKARLVRQCRVETSTTDELFELIALLLDYGAIMSGEDWDPLDAYGLGLANASKLRSLLINYNLTDD